jgi:hypothetical protein
MATQQFHIFTFRGVAVPQAYDIKVLSNPLSEKKKEKS